MDFDQNNKEELKKKFDGVIKKSEIQMKILKKILLELNKDNELGKDNSSNTLLNDKTQFH